MKYRFRGNVLEIEDARIIYRNFSGVGSKYNREGDKGFSVVISDDELKEELIAAGWNVKIREPREGYEDPLVHLPVKVKYNKEGRGPAIYVLSGKGKPTLLDADSVNMLDEIDIASVSMDLRPYDWEINGKAGTTAYLQAMEVTQNIDRFGAKYTEDDLPF